MPFPYTFPIELLQHETTYYVDFTTGDDADTGLTEELAWKTWDKARVQTYAAGDFIKFKCGEVWDVFTTYTNEFRWSLGQSGASGNPITITSYGTGAKPIIRAILDVKGVTDDWTDMTGNIWRRTTTGLESVHRVWIDGSGFTNQESVMPAAYTSINATKYLWFYDETNDYLYVYATANPATNYTYVNICKELPLIITSWPTGRSYWTIDGLDFRGGGDQIYLRHDTSYIEIKNCNFQDWNREAILLWGSYAGTAISYITVDNCTFDGNQNFISNATTEAEQTYCVNDVIWLHQAASNCTIKNSTFKNSGHDCIEILGSSATQAGCNDNTIEHNIFGPDDKSPYSRPFDVNGYADKADSNIFRYNLCQHFKASSQVNGSDSQVYYNVFYHGDNSSATGMSGLAQGLLIQHYGGSYVCDGIKVYNNIFKDNVNSGLVLLAAVDAVPTNCLIKNNIFINNSIEDCSWGFGVHIQIVNYDTNYSSTNIFDHNCIYDADTTSTIYYKTGVQTVAWMDANDSGWGDNLSSDPLVGADYKIQSTSPCVDTGVDVDLTQDYFGNEVPGWGGIDIGAHETYVQKVIII